MVKHWGVASFVALALLACLVGTEVEAHGQGWLNLPAKNAGQQGQGLGLGQGQGQGQRLGLGQSRGQGQGQGRGQGQGQGQGRGQGQRLGLGLGQGQRLGLDQGQQLGLGLGLGQGQRLGLGQGQGQGWGQGQRLGHGRGSRSSRGSRRRGNRSRGSRRRRRGSRRRGSHSRGSHSSHSSRSRGHGHHHGHKHDNKHDHHHGLHQGLLHNQTPVRGQKLQNLQIPRASPIFQNNSKTNLAIGGQQQQNPQIPQRPYISKPILSKNPPAESCEVAKNTRIPCGRPEISPDECKDINCCFDGQQCYYGKAVTVQCTKDGHFIVVVARDATLPNIDLESISLLSNGQGCSHVDSNSDFAIYYFPVTSCGTVVLEEPGVIIYENKMFSSYEVETGPRGVITRDSHYELIFQARYIGTAVQTVVVEVLPLSDPPLPVSALGPIRVELRLGNGQCISKGCNEVDVAYTSFYTEADYPVTKVLRDPVYVEVQLMEKTDPNLVLTLGRCWATTSPNPHSLPQWDILTDGCPCRNDNYLSSLVPVDASSGLDLPSHYRRFLFKMFTFVDHSSKQPMREQVYIHCSTAVCTPAAGYSCEPTCYRKRRDVMAVDQTHSESMVVVSVGPVSMGASPE